MSREALVEFYDKFLKDSYVEFTRLTNIGTAIKVKIDVNGNVKDNIDVVTEEGKFFNSYTLQSMVRSTNATVAVHPFFDYTKNILGFVNKKIKQSNENGVNVNYITQLHNFNETYGITETIAIERFYDNAESMKLLNEFIGSHEKLEDSYILIELLDNDVQDSELWNNRNILLKWKDYMYDNLKNEDGRVLTTKSPRINYFGRLSYVTSNDDSKLINGFKKNLPVYDYSMLFKETTTIDHLLNDGRHSVVIDAKTKDVMLIFSLDDMENNDDLLSMVSCSKDDEKDKTPEYDSTSSMAVSDAINKKCYDVETIRNSNVYIMEFCKVADKVLTIKDCMMMPVGTLHENIDFWKNNFTYDGSEAGRFSIFSIVKLLDKFSKKRVLKNFLNCMINKDMVPECAIRDISNVVKRKFVFGDKKLNKKLTEDNTNDNMIISMLKYNNKLTGEDMNTQDRNVLLGKIHMYLMDFEFCVRKSRKMNTNTSRIAKKNGMFLTNPNLAITTYFKESGFITDSENSHKYHGYRFFEKCLTEFTELGYSLNEPIDDFAKFVYGKQAARKELEEMRNSKKNKDTQENENS